MKNSYSLYDTAKLYFSKQDEEEVDPAAEDERWVVTAPNNNPMPLGVFDSGEAAAKKAEEWTEKYDTDTEIFCYHEGSSGASIYHRERAYCKTTRANFEEGAKVLVKYDPEILDLMASDFTFFNWRPDKPLKQRDVKKLRKVGFYVSKTKICFDFYQGKFINKD